ncbi:MAG: ParB N-terminal domain-containing protein [Firmicutes bacterium]|nr:ParB N-terminal domain-containing protein [Bacillota bacterium]
MLTQKTSGPSVLQTGRVLFLPLGAIRPNPAQPRSVFDAAGLQGLAASIRQYGVLQPLSVRKKGSGFDAPPGKIRIVNKKLEISCGKDSVVVDEIQFKGGKRMTVASYLNGHDIDENIILK